MLRKGRHKGLFDRLVTEFCSEDLVGLGLLTGVDRRVGALEAAELGITRRPKITAVSSRSNCPASYWSYRCCVYLVSVYTVDLRPLE